MKTMRRDKLKRDVAKGLYEAKCNYYLTDDYAHDASVNNGETDWLPAYLKADSKDNREGHMGFLDWDFASSSGMAWIDADNIVTLKIHSNCSYKLRSKNMEIKK